MEDRDDNFARQMAALSHPARLKILRWLALHENCQCKQVVDALPLAQSTVSQHLKVLVAAGLVTREPCGTASHFVINRNALTALGQSTGLFIQSCCANSSRDSQNQKAIFLE